MSIFTFIDNPPPLSAPVLIVALDGWVDAGGAATAAAQHIARDGVTIGSFDTDALLDYRARRPILDVLDGVQSSLTWPEIAVRLVRADGRDVLVLTGPEPDYRWKEFAASILELAVRAGVQRSIALGALPAAVAHTMPTPMLATASDSSLLDHSDRTPEGLLRVPAAALSVVQMHLAAHGIPTVGFFAQVPHYVTPAYTPGALALVERVARHLTITLSLGDLPEEAQDQRVQLDAIVEGRPEIKRYVEQLESLSPGSDLESSGPLPSGDEIAEEVERYLRRSRGEGPE